jgi:hypothetical protein
VLNIAKLLGLNRPIESAPPVKYEPPPGRRMRPLIELYQPGERFEISQAGLLAWRESPAFKRVAAF